MTTIFHTLPDEVLDQILGCCKRPSQIALATVLPSASQYLLRAKRDDHLRALRDRPSPAKAIEQAHYCWLPASISKTNDAIAFQEACRSDDAEAILDMWSHARIMALPTALRHTCIWTRLEDIEHRCARESFLLAALDHGWVQPHAAYWTIVASPSIDACNVARDRVQQQLPLLVAAQNGYWRIVHRLLDTFRGANATKRMVLGVLAAAFYHGERSVIERLVRNFQLERRIPRRLATSIFRQRQPVDTLETAVAFGWRHILGWLEPSLDGLLQWRQAAWTTPQRRPSSLLLTTTYLGKRSRYLIEP
ncbi:hypothetical protein SDRG_04594 [Saprolegnia diclina VS20]|uniref:Uncharacterized protein n=1 Tax=Saprolegnia diclina (strain VS20) TaxID=1156394 RepID=T0QVV4_SAPDV|nr:hypothetical protein SDRG_04594 [Saprolegnia diclina VS20]EQC38165.1 hypothetical protein SDRG_04594 [Saprolegnia diclina VS20]|eukprot:XP_008608492.1 hypothetical protein SDRG_04594 [Saprolegnia diclina VS20]